MHTQVQRYTWKNKRIYHYWSHKDYVKKEGPRNMHIQQLRHLNNPEYQKAGIQKDQASCSFPHYRWQWGRTQIIIYWCPLGLFYHRLNQELMKRRICGICSSLMKTTLAAVDRVWGVVLGFSVQAVEQLRCICSSGPHSCKKVRKWMCQQDTDNVETKIKIMSPFSIKNF